MLGATELTRESAPTLGALVFQSLPVAAFAIGSDRAFHIEEQAWMIWSVWWLAMAFFSKSTKRRESPLQRIEHLLPALLGFTLVDHHQDQSSIDTARALSLDPASDLYRDAGGAAGDGDHTGVVEWSGRVRICVYCVVSKGAAGRVVFVTGIWRGVCGAPAAYRNVFAAVLVNSAPQWNRRSTEQGTGLETGHYKGSKKERRPRAAAT